MSVYSMTGYASTSANRAETHSQPAVPDAPTPRSTPDSSASVTVELRSVNGRFLDLSLRLPDELRSLEPALRELVGSSFRRGKIELRLSTQTSSSTPWPQPQPEQLNRLSHLQGTVRGWLPQARELSVHEVLQWCKDASGPEHLDEVAMDAARGAVAGLQQARAREGQRMADALLERVARLRALAAQAEPLVPAAVARQQHKFLERWNEALAITGTGAAQSLPEQALAERAINEAAAFAIRIDVAEELARLRSHFDEMARILKTGGEVGKRLDFLIQELLREANTLGSKSSSLDLTNISLEMKVLIEQLRELVQNIE
jgi:uncharacterized protein (TIGR00255 family)